MEGGLNTYETLISYGTHMIDARDQEGDTEEKLRNRIQQYCLRIQTVLDDQVDPYVVYDGKIIAANPWEGDADYDYTSAVWYQKAMEANNAGVDFFISIHRNSYPTDNAVSGVESLVYDKSGIKLEMAENINDQLESIGFVNLGVKARPGLVVLRRTKMPAVLVEVGFINSDTDNRLFDDNFDDIALAIAEGILGTLDTGNTGGASGYTVQVGAYRNPDNADRLVRELRELDFPAELSEGDGLYLVTVGAWPTLDEAAAMEQRLKRAGYQTLIISR